ncbi:MAG: phage holin family protein [Candidatus Omnitrophota bacterium]
MTNFLIKWVVNIAALFIVIHLVAGVNANSWESIIVAAFVLGLLNAFVKPFIILFTLPFTILTLGLFTLIINASLFYLASKFVRGFEVINFWSAFWAALLFSIISSVLNFILTPKAAIRYNSFRRESGNSRKIDDDNVIDVEGKVEK